MGNALERDIEVGEEVIVGQYMFFKAFAMAQRVFICADGEGMLASSSGRQIDGKWKHPWEKDGRGTIFGYWINAKETMEWQRNQ